MRVFIAEDDENNRVLLRHHLLSAACQVIGEAANGTDAIAWLKANPDVDAAFLDVRMPGANALQILDALEHPPLTVFVTGDDSYAAQAYQYDVFQYLLKPFDRWDVVAVVAKIRSHLRAHGLRPLRVEVYRERGTKFVNTERIAYYEVAPGGTKEIWAQYASEPTRLRLVKFRSLGDLAEAFPGVIRISRSVAIRLDWVLGVDESNAQVMSGGSEISLPCSEEGIRNLRKALYVAPSGAHRKLEHP